MIKFVEKRKIYFTVSLLLIAVAIICLFTFGVQLDIQFKGGTIITYSFEGDLNKDQFKSLIEKRVVGSVSIQESLDAISGKENLKISLSESKGVSSDDLSAISSELTTTFAANKLELVSANSVDPVIGKEFMTKSLVAVIFAALLMILYVGLRFRVISGWSAGVMAVVALMHDIFIVFATFIIFQIPINDNFIAVVLTILGYSLNDTIVIYDRIRENKRLYGAKITLTELVDKSINQSLTRSIATTFTTILAMASILAIAIVFNLSSIISFAFPMIIGMLSGVYSSICIAGPLWVMWQDKKAGRKTA